MHYRAGTLTVRVGKIPGPGAALEPQACTERIEQRKRQGLDRGMVPGSPEDMVLSCTRDLRADPMYIQKNAKTIATQLESHWFIRPFLPR